MLSVQGGGPVDVVSVDLDSDDTRPYKTEWAPDGSGKTTRPFLDTQARHAEEGEMLPFEFVATTESCWCKWEIVVKVAYDDMEETVVVRSDGTENGPPFETIDWSFDDDFGYDSIYDDRPGNRSMGSVRLQRAQLFWRVRGALN